MPFEHDNVDVLYWVVYNFTTTPNLRNEQSVQDRPFVKPVRKRPDYDLIYSTLRERICLLDLPPGAVLSENALAAEFGASRTPIRRVLHRLEFEGLVHSRHGVGTIVSVVEMPYIRQMYALRLALTNFIADLPPNYIRDHHVTAIRELRTALTPLQTGEPAPRLLAQHYIQYHVLLSAAIGNQPLNEIGERLFIQSLRIWMQLLPELNWQEEVQALIDELAAVADALEARDMHRVAALRRTYMEGYMARLTRYLSGPV